MKLLKRIFGPSLSPTWEYSPGGTIWKLQVTTGGVLVGESRDLERRTMSLFAVRLADGSEIFRDRSFAEPWWIALELMVDDLALLHRYPRPDMPNVLGVTAVDSNTGEVLWERDDLRAVCGASEILLAQQGESQTASLLLVDARTGDLLSKPDPEQAIQFQLACDDTGRWSDWIPGEELEESHPMFGTIMELLGRLPEERRGPVEVADYGAYTVVGAHLRSRASAQAMLNNQVDSIVMVVQGERTLFRQVVTHGAPGPSQDLFFIRNGQLIFIRDRTTLVAIDLTN